VNFVFESLLELIFAVVSYGVGSMFVVIFLPWYGVESLSHDAPQPRSWKWRGFSHVEGGRRYLRCETVQLIGLAILIGVIVMIAALPK
jgi:hypothetical protein